MSAQNDTQAAFMEAMNGLKEYAKVNGGFITKDDVLSYFKDLDLDDGKLQMVYGYLMANNIKIKGAASEDNEFLKMMETAEAEEIQKQEAEETNQEEQAGAKQLEESLDYAEDDKYLQLYLEDLKQVDMLSDTSLAFLLMNIVEDNDKNSLELLSQTFLGKVTEWITPYRGKGVLACDLVQEGNLAMLSYIGQKQWANNYEWKDKIKEGSTQDLLEVLHGIEKEVRELVEGLAQLQAQRFKILRDTPGDHPIVADKGCRLNGCLMDLHPLVEIVQKQHLRLVDGLEGQRQGLGGFSIYFFVGSAPPCGQLPSLIIVEQYFPEHGFRLALVAPDGQTCGDPLDLPLTVGIIKIDHEIETSIFLLDRPCSFHHKPPLG